MGWVTGIRLPAGAWIFLFATASRPAPVQGYRRLFPPGVKRYGFEVDPSSSCSAGVKTAWSCGSVHTQPHPNVWCSVQVMKLLFLYLLILIQNRSAPLC
jgi:hypothetical protein